MLAIANGYAVTAVPDTGLLTVTLSLVFTVQLKPEYGLDLDSK